MYNLMISALQTLAGVCDGARTDDGMGFNGRDARFGHGLANQSMQRELTPAQEWAALKMLQTYRNQLSGRGVVLPTLTEYSHRSQTKNRITQVASVMNRRPVTEVTVSAHAGMYAIKFKYDEAVAAKVKELSVRKFTREPVPMWLCPPDMAGEIQEKLAAYDLIWDEPAKMLRDKATQVRSASAKQEAELDTPNLTGELMPFQKAGVAFLEAAEGRAIIGDDMGLGKTIQAIGYLSLHPEMRPAVIIVPASLKPNWKREIAKWLVTEETVHVISGRKNYDVPDSQILIINYDILAAWTNWFAQLDPAIVICDEAHLIKSPKAARTKAVIKLANQSDKVVLMTGTPMMNRPVELFPLLQATHPTQWSNFMTYARRYCNARQRVFKGRKVWDFSGASNLPELNSKLKNVMIRRLKKDVLTDLPPKRRVLVPMPIDLKQYGRFIEDTLEQLELEGNRAAQLAIIEEAKQYVLEMKMDAICEWIDNFLDSDEKLIVFCTHRATVAALVERYKDIQVRITGDSSQEERDYAVQAFQTHDSTRIFIGNIQAAGVGITLTAASNVAFVELGWRPGDQTQAEDRAHRYGQTQSVTAWYLMAEGTIEETIYNMLEKKRATVELAIDGAVDEFGFNEGNIVDDVVNELLKGRKK